jgi:hypothetical protein
MTTTQEEAELMFSKWMESSSKIFFAPTRSHGCGQLLRQCRRNFPRYGPSYGNWQAAEVGLKDAQFAFVTERNLPEEVRGELDSGFDAGIFMIDATIICLLF